ncbi:hypothetical protein B7767_43410, partial [Streptomyces sp. 13-12-16]
MGLDVVAGVLVDAEDDYAETVRADFAAIGGLLERAGLRRWTEPDPAGAKSAEFEVWGYSGLHTVRRLAVHLAAGGRLPEPLGEGSRGRRPAPARGPGGPPRRSSRTVRPSR